MINTRSLLVVTVAILMISSMGTVGVVGGTVPAHPPETEMVADNTETPAQNRTSQAPDPDSRPNKSGDTLRGGGAIATNTVSTQELSTTSRVRVVLTVTDWSPTTASKLRDRGATIEMRSGTRVQALVNRSAVGEYRQQSWVERVRRPRTGTPQVVSEGVSAINADTLHAEGITGENVTIGVIDFGFDPTNPEIQDNLAGYRSFTQNGGIRGGQTEHGTAVAELVADTAPDSELYVANYNTGIEYVNAAEWLRAQGVDVIITSIGFVGVPYDGSSYIAQSADRIVNDGVVWINSAGNYANLHWQGSMTNADQDGWPEFSEGDETNYLRNPREGTISISLTWDDWPDSNQDYDLYLYRDPAFGDDQLVAKSDASQTGTQAPSEFINTRISPSPFDKYYVSIRNYDASGDHKFNLYVTQGAESLQYTVRQGSLSAPATGDRVLSVGAFNSETGEREPFSSAGPTEDGEQGIDVLGPDGVTTSGYTRDCTLFFFCDGSRFYGTSAAAPHVAGVAGLMLAENQQLQPSQVEQLLESTASDVPSGGFSYTAGHGEIAAARAVRSVPQSDSGSISLSLPQTYTINNELDITGTTSGAVDDVALYARNEGEFRLVGIDRRRSLAVDSTGTFAAETVRLTAGSLPGNTLLTTPGSYDLVAIRAVDADTDGDGEPDSYLSEPIVSSGVSTQRSLTVTRPSLSAQFPTIEDGALPGDTLTVTGTAPGYESVLVVAVGENGATVAERLSVSANDSFDEEAISLRSLPSGSVSLYVVASGIDRTIGNGDIPGESGGSLADFERYIEQTLQTERSTRRSVGSGIRSQSILEVGSDDNLLAQTTELRSTTRTGLDGRGTFNTTTGEGTILSGATVFQGEADIRFGGSLTASLVRIPDESSLLTTPIPQTQPTGQYSTTGTRSAPSVTVARPRVTTLTVQNEAGTNISGETIRSEAADTVTVVADSNFGAAEALELTVENENGVDITTEVLTTGSPIQPDGSAQQVRWQLSLAAQAPDTVTLSVSGSDDLDFGAAERATTITVEPDGESAAGVTLAATVQDSGQPGDPARIRYELANTSTQNSVTLNFTELPSTVSINESASDLDGGTLGTGAIIWFAPTGSLNSAIAFDISEEANEQVTIRAQVEDENGVPTDQADTILQTDTTETELSVSTSLGSSEVTPGETTTVTTRITNPGPSVTLNDSFTPAADSASVESVMISGEAATPIIQEATENGSVVTLSGLQPSDSVTITYAIDVGEETPVGTTYRVNSEIASSGEKVTSTQTITVVEGGPVARFDTDGNGIEIGELGSAAIAFAQGDLTIAELGQVATSFAQS